MNAIGREIRRVRTWRSRMRRPSIVAGVIAAWAAAVPSVQTSAQQARQQASQIAPARTTGAEPVQASTASTPDPRGVLDKHCIPCHNQRLRTAGLALDTFDVTTPSTNAEVSERIIAKLRAGSMPPLGRPRPDAATYRAVASRLETDIDRAWAAHPNPGRTSAVHRLNRTEYSHVIRDLFAIDPRDRKSTRLNSSH